MSRQPYSRRGSKRRLREIRLDRRSIRILWVLGVMVLLLLWMLPWLMDRMRTH